MNLPLLARLITASLSLGASAQASTAILTVNTTVDEFDTPSGADLSLREAVRDAADLAGADSIGFAAALSGQTITLNSEIILGSSLATGITIDGGPGSNRIFYVNPGQTVSLIGLALTGGNATGGDPVAEGFGGALHNYGILSVKGCTFNGNTATNGGAIHTGIRLIESNLDVRACTFTGNTATNSGGSINAQDHSTIVQCTFFGNSSGGTSTGGGAVSGAADPVKLLTLEHCTIAGNSTMGGGGGVRRSNGMVTIKNCIVAQNTAAKLGTENLDAGVTQTGANITSGDPLLSPLGGYGGPTRTMALKPASPARNAASGSSVTSDQRGFPIVGARDIGAYEAGTMKDFITWSWESAGSLLSFSGDSDGDGASDGIEYAMRRDPLKKDPVLRPTFTNPDPSTRRFRFRYQSNTRDLRYIVQRSSSLAGAASWAEIYRYDTSTGVITRNGVTSNEQADTQLLTVFDPTPERRAFWRLVVEQVP